jgi:hypothetical protein
MVKILMLDLAMDIDSATYNWLCKNAGKTKKPRSIPIATKQQSYIQEFDLFSVRRDQLAATQAHCELHTRGTHGELRTQGEHGKLHAY